MRSDLLKLGVSDGIRTHDIQDHNLTFRLIKPIIRGITAGQQR